jgi:hypothetical protein
MYTILAQFMLMGIAVSMHLDHTTQRTSCYSHCSFFWNLTSGRLGVTTKLMHFLDNSNQMNFKDLPGFSKYSQSFSTYITSSKICIFWTRTLEQMSLWLFQVVHTLNTDRVGIKIYELCDSSFQLCLIFSCLCWMRHGTNESVLDCKNKQNCSNCNKTVRSSSWSWIQCLDGQKWFHGCLNVTRSLC